ncbi:MAG: molybdenum cofactor guanylyltransferase [Syntrophorhabdaceae bacterium]
MDTACAILAGGKSSRMGRDKATAEFRGSTLVNSVYDIVKDLFDDVIIVSSKHETIANLNIPIVKDIAPVQSPIVGIATALIYTRKPRIFIVACDMPFVSREAIQCILEASQGRDVTIPMIGDYYEPLHAIYSRYCLAHFLKFMQMNDLRISNIFPYVTMTVVKDAPCFKRGDDHVVFSNINTEEELKRLNAGGEE